MNAIDVGSQFLGRIEHFSTFFADDSRLDGGCVFDLVDLLFIFQLMRGTQMKSEKFTSLKHAWAHFAGERTGFLGGWHLNSMPSKPVLVGSLLAAEHAIAIRT